MVSEAWQCPSVHSPWCVYSWGLCLKEVGWGRGKGDSAISNFVYSLREVTKRSAENCPQSSCTCSAFFCLLVSFRAGQTLQIKWLSKVSIQINNHILWLETCSIFYKRNRELLISVIGYSMIFSFLKYLDLACHLASPLSVRGFVESSKNFLKNISVQLLWIAQVVCLFVPLEVWSVGPVEWRSCPFFSMYF